MKTENNKQRTLKGIIPFLLLLILIGNGYSQDIHSEVAGGDIKKVESLLKENPLLVNKEDGRGCTPIYTAIMKKNLNMVKLLIKNGASVRIGDHNLRAPIHMAGFMNDKDMISLLLKGGAVVDSRAIGAATSLIHSSYSNRYELSKFLIEKGADINIQCNSLTTPLYFAVLNNNLPYLEYLIKKGADIDTPDFLGRTPLYIAVRDGYTEIAEKLIESGADINFQDKYSGQSLLHLGAVQGHEEIVRLLIQKGLIVNLKDREKCTPLDHALRYGHEKTVGILEENGGKPNRFYEFLAKSMIFDQNPQTGEGIIVKLQNGSWGIRTRNHFLIFAYSEIGDPPPNKSLNNGYLSSTELSEVPWVCLDMGYHPPKTQFALQGRNPLYSMQGAGQSLSFVLNLAYKNVFSKLNLGNTYFPEPQQSLKIGDIAVTVIPSYQHKKGYMVECDGLKIFWLSGICDNYITNKRDIKAIKMARKKFSSVDLLFLGTPGGIGPEIGNGIRETYIESRSLNSKAVFFMGKSITERRILNQINRQIKAPKNIYCSGNPGDRFFYKEGEIQ